MNVLLSYDDPPHAGVDFLIGDEGHRLFGTPIARMEPDRDGWFKVDIKWGTVLRHQGCPLYVGCAGGKIEPYAYTPNLSEEGILIENCIL